MLLVKNATLLDESNKMDILIDDQGKYKEIAEKIDISGYDECEVIDAEGSLVTPTFVNPHMHLDKVYTSIGGRESKVETLEESIKIMHDRKKIHSEDVKRRAVKPLKNV